MSVQIGINEDNVGTFFAISLGIFATFPGANKVAGVLWAEGIFIVFIAHRLGVRGESFLALR
ncbi:MAG: hypothetical protein U5O39_20080 [Gammaproteobacteria bacterium]|nr:hypothetical protein [Gammaproteobacteria bacterium]